MQENVLTPRPKFCPNCETALPDGSHGAQEFSADESGETNPGWDCYCAACGWSGDIFPDKKLEATQ